MKNSSKYAVVFAGQGAQKPGMGKSLYERSAAARAIFDAAGAEIKYDCFDADEDRLRQTEVTQPAVYTMDMAAWAALCESLKRGEEFAAPIGVAGFSLGEYAAFTAARAIDRFETGLALVRKRSLLMKEAGTNPDGGARGAMAAGMGARDSVLALVEKARETDVLEAVNFNSPQQTVVAGDAAAVTRFAELAKEDRSLGVKAIPLSVSGAFHSPLMLSAAEGLAVALDDYAFQAPIFPVYLNTTGGLFDGGGAADAAIKAVMIRQIQSPVQWQTTVETMATSGVDTIIEVGPGKTLSGLVKKIAPDVRTLHVEDAASLDETIAAFE